MKFCHVVPEARSHRYVWNVWDQEDEEWLESFIIDDTNGCQLSRNESEPVLPAFHGFPSPSKKSDAHKTPDQPGYSTDGTMIRRSSRKLALKKKETAGNNQELRTSYEDEERKKE